MVGVVPSRDATVMVGCSGSGREAIVGSGG